MSDFELARDNLQISSVSSADIQAKLADDIVPESVNSDAMTTQMMHKLKAIRSVEFSNDEKQTWGYHFSYVCGFRYVVKESSDAPEEPKVLFTLMAEFVAKYHSETGLSAEALEAFGMKNVCYHVWPYWRELAHSTLARFELPRASIPHYFALEE